MCGIVGFITGEEKAGQKARVDYVTDSLIVDMLRGFHSTGVMYGHTMSPDRQCGMFKRAVKGVDFVNTDIYKEHIVDNKSALKFVVGHNRWATAGSVKQANAHPFRHEAVTGVHNGTIRGGMHTLPITMAQSKCEVDSDCVMMNLNHVDPDEAATKVIPHIYGAYMLVWYDNRDGSLNMVRNSSREFHIAQTYGNEDTLLFSSESGALEWIARRNNFNIGDVQFLKPGHLLKWTDKNGLVPEVTKIEAPKGQTYTAGKSGTSQPGAGGGAKPGKPAARHYGAQGNLVNVAGRPREVPLVMQEELLDLELAVEDRLIFVPQMHQGEETLPRPDAPRFVSGWIDSLGLNAICYRVEKVLVEKHFDRPWQVRPVGVKYTNRAGHPMVICEIVTSSAPTKEVRTLVGKTNSSPTSTTDSKKETTAGFEGPGGSQLCLADWVEATKGGCTSCQKQLTTDMAEGMRWDLITGEPQCPDCAALDDEYIANMLARHEIYYH